MTPLAYYPPVALWALALVAANLLVAWPALRSAAAHRAHPAHRVEASTPGQVRPAPPARSP
jgi:hypothetical protein